MRNSTEYLKREQKRTLEMPHHKFSLPAKFLFVAMDLVAGKKNTLPKAKLLEILASIPYRAWEIRHYAKLTRKFRNIDKVKLFQEVVEWGRSAQDNEYTHLLVIHEKMKEDGMKERWYLYPVITYFIVLGYVIFAKLLACISQKKAYLFNAEFEKHAEGVYAGMVSDNPQWENEKVNNELVKLYADVETWADVFRRVSLDERDHMNNSYIFAGSPQDVVSYEGMPEKYKF